MNKKYASAKSLKRANFFKRNIYYFGSAGAAVITALTVVLIVALTAAPAAPKVPEPETPAGNKPIVFTVPVASYTSVSRDFADDKLVYNPTLKQWETHEGLDFAAAAGSAVLAAYDGTVDSVTSNSLSGTTVTILHSDNLKTVYRSLADAVTVTAGAKVKAGQQIGTVSDSQKTEAHAGTHLHFEVYLNGKAVDPAAYMAELGDK